MSLGSQPFQAIIIFYINIFCYELRVNGPLEISNRKFQRLAKCLFSFFTLSNSVIRVKFVLGYCPLSQLRLSRQWSALCSFHEGNLTFKYLQTVNTCQAKLTAWLTSYIASMNSNFLKTKAWTVEFRGTGIPHFSEVHVIPLCPYKTHQPLVFGN